MDKNGKEYYVDSSGKHVELSQEDLKNVILEQVAQKVYIDENGVERNLDVDESGRAFYTDSKGRKIYPKTDPPKIEIDEHGNPVIVDAFGNKQKVLLDNDG